MVADEQQVQPAGQLRARQVCGRGDRLGLIGVMVQVGRIPAVRGRIEQHRDRYVAAVVRPGFTIAQLASASLGEEPAAGGDRKR